MGTGERAVFLGLLLVVGFDFALTFFGAARLSSSFGCVLILRVFSSAVGAAAALGVAFLTAAFFRFCDGFAVLEDAGKLTATFTRAKAAVTSCSASRTALAEHRSATSDVHASILASRLRTLFGFTTVPSFTFGKTLTRTSGLSEQKVLRKTGHDSWADGSVTQAKRKQLGGYKHNDALAGRPFLTTGVARITRPC
ncbi:MAG TPA: hypothetical protein VGN17_01280 [Bryobacteraceae bacterium]